MAVTGFKRLHSDLQIIVSLLVAAIRKAHVLPPLVSSVP
jgi:hypothetical protein